MKGKKEGVLGVADTIIRLAKECPPTVGKVILEQYQSIPFVVREAVEEFYEAKGRIDDKDGIEAIKGALKKLREACEANPRYKEVYQSTKEEAQGELAEVIANNRVNVFEDED